MVIAEVGDLIKVTFDTTFEIEGFENTLPTKNKDGEVISRALADEVDGENIYNYLLQFSEVFDLVNVSGVVVSQIDSLWYSEAELTGEVEEEVTLPYTTKELNIAIKFNQRVVNQALSSAQKIVNKIPQGDQVFRGVSEDILSVINNQNSYVQGIKYNPKSTESKQNVIADLEGSELVAQDSQVFISFLEDIDTQQTFVNRRTTELNRQEEQAVTNASKSAESNSTAVNRIIDTRADLEASTDLDNLIQGYTPADWESIGDSNTPDVDSTLPDDQTTSQEAADLFPDLQPGSVVASGLV